MQIQRLHGPEETSEMRVRGSGALTKRQTCPSSMNSQKQRCSPVAPLRTQTNKPEKREASLTHMCSTPAVTSEPLSRKTSTLSVQTQDPEDSQAGHRQKSHTGWTSTTRGPLDASLNQRTRHSREAPSGTIWTVV